MNNEELKADEATIQEMAEETESKSDEKPKKSRKKSDKKLEKLEQEIGEQKDKYLRLYSEFENFRRRSAKERLELISTASSELMEELLPVLDDFERALKSFSDEEQHKEIKEGIELVYHKYKRVLENKGLKEIEVAAGSEFDSEFQEAITKIPAPQEELKGKVVDVIEKGYKMSDKVLRFAKVVIGE